MTNSKLSFRPSHHRHEAILMAWPGSQNLNYTRQEISSLKTELTAIATTISNYETVTLLVHSSDISEAETAFRNCCGTYGVNIETTDTADLESWMRVVAPVFVFADGSSHSGYYGIDFNFNGWGGRYPSAGNAHFAGQFLASRGIPRIETPLVLEGGALETDGEGTLLLTESSVINPNRNPNVSREAIEKELCWLLGMSKVIWVPGLKNYEVTDGHIDTWARFVAPGRVVLHYPGPNRRLLMPVYEKTREILSRATDSKGRQLEVVDLPGAGLDHPEPVDPDLCLNYVNYVLVYGAVIMARFGDREDDRARDILQALFPERKIVQVYIGEIAANGGGIHCVTQEIPGKRDKSI